ncbi:LPS-assembly protein LptD [Methylocystis bryophila]|nr:LPS-assembly protein LptD [Methylocystis bryophila]
MGNSRALSRLPTTAVREPWPKRGRGLARLLSFLLLGSSLFVPAAAWGEKAASPEPRMVVEARELVYDQTKNTVSARGNVQIYYKGRLLEADRVTYDRDTGRIRAEGHARLTEADGAVERAESFDLTDDFKNGFIQSLQADTADNTHFGAPYAERRGDASSQETIFDHGTYTACDACKDDPSKPRLWQIHAKRIIHDGVEKMIYYEDATLEFLDFPVAYMPYWSSPDPTVKRKSGLLMPTETYGSYVGYGFGVPIYWAISPNADLTVTPTYFTKQGPLLKGEYRQRFETGSFSILAEGTKPNDRGAFPSPPYGASNLKYRGAVESRGEFYPNDYWKFGWDVTALSDRYFLQDYRQWNPLYGNLFFKERSSTVYLTGQGDRSWFDMRAYYFQGLSPNDLQAQLPTAHPITDYNRAFDVDPYKTMGIGGQVTLDANFTSTSAQIADYESIQPRTLDKFNGLYTVCSIYSPTPNRANSTCLLRGIGGNYESGTVEASWKRRAIDPVGGVWTPFAFARFSGSYLNYNTTDTAPVYNATLQPIPNAAQGLFVNGADNSFNGQVTPGAGVEWRYPLIARSAAGALVLEPIAQVIARPNQSSIPSLVNMDAQSLVFDDTNLFEWSKFSGYNRFETGTRANYGGQGTFTLNNGGYVNALIGQSAQLAGQNSYATADAANVGLSSGLDHRVSDIVGRLVVSPISPITFTAKALFDPATFAARRVDGFASIKLDPMSFDVHYANYEAQPLIGFDKRRQGLAFNAKYNLTKNYFVSGTVTFDMSRYLYNGLTLYPTLYTTYTGINLQGTAPVFSVAALGFGGGYQDECTTFLVNYTSNYTTQTNTGLPARNQTVMVSLQLRTLGAINFNQSLGTFTMNDGVRSQP